MRLRDSARLLAVMLVVAVIVLALGGRAVAAEPWPADPQVGARRVPAQAPLPPQAPPLEERVSKLEVEHAAMKAQIASLTNQVQALQAGKVVPAVGAASASAAAPAAAAQPATVLHPVGTRGRTAAGQDVVCTANGTWQPVAAAQPVQAFGGFVPVQTIQTVRLGGWGDLTDPTVDPTPQPAPGPSPAPTPGFQPFGGCANGQCGATGGRLFGRFRGF